MMVGWVEWFVFGVLVDAANGYVLEECCDVDLSCCYWVYDLCIGMECFGLVLLS